MRNEINSSREERKSSPARLRGKKVEENADFRQFSFLLLGFNLFLHPVGDRFSSDTHQLLA